MVAPNLGPGGLGRPGGPPRSERPRRAAASQPRLVRELRRGGTDDDDGGGNIIGLLALAILAPIAAGLIQLALSRSREYQADASGAHLIGEGEPLARALQKIEAAAKRTPMDVNPAEATAYIINPLTGRKVNFANLFSSHPPTEERIARLRTFDRTHAI